MHAVMKLGRVHVMITIDKDTSPAPITSLGF